MSRLKKNTKYILISFIIALIFCSPFISGCIRVGSDTTFHLNRIEALKEAILNKNFYPYVYLNQNFGYGYGTPSFYGQIFLYPFALLRILGLCPARTWRVLIFAIVFFSSLTVSYAYRKIFKDDSTIASILVSAFYLFNADVLNRLHIRGAIGEGFALIFIPLIVLNIHRFIKEDADNYVGLGVTFACLLLSHNISFIIMCIVFGIIILFNIKDIIKNKIGTIIKAVLLGGALSLFFILPMIEQLRNGIYFINYQIADNDALIGMKLIDYFSFLINDHGDNGIGLGLVLLLVPLISYRNKENKYFMITGYVLLLVASCLFPWKYLSALSFIQFTTRLITIALSYLALCSTYGILNTNNKTKKIINNCLCAITACFFLIGCYGIFEEWGAIKNSTSAEQIISGEKLFSKWDQYSYSVPETSGVEYLPQNNDYDYRTDCQLHYAYDEDMNKYPVLAVDGFDYSYLINLNNHKNLTFSRIYYRGYVVDVFENEQYVTTLKTKVDTNRYALVSADIPEEYRNKELQFTLRYVGTKVQKISTAISLLTLLLTIYLIIKNKRQKHKVI